MPPVSIPVSRRLRQDADRLHLVKVSICRRANSFLQWTPVAIRDTMEEHVEGNRRCLRIDTPAFSDHRRPVRLVPQAAGCNSLSALFV